MIANDGGAVLARLARIPSSPWHVRARLTLGIATFFDAFDLLTISFALPAFAQSWAMTPTQIGLVLSSAFFGQLIGALGAGWLAERYGRLPVVSASVATYALMSIACAQAWNPSSLIAFRFVQGLGLGAEVPIATTYVSEVAPAGVRGRFYVVYELIFVVGLIAAGLLGAILVPRFGWRVMFYIGALPLLLALVLTRVLPESPRWLVVRGRIAEADAAVRTIEDAAIAAGRTLPDPGPSVAVAPKEKADVRELFRGVYRRRTLCVWALWFCCFSTTYGLNTWLPTLYKTVFHLGLAQSLNYGLITQIVGIGGSALLAVLVDRVGRKPLFTIGFLAGGASLLALWFTGAGSAELLLTVVSLGTFFMSAVAIGLNLYTPELYPTRVRALGNSIGGAWQRVAAGIGPNVVAALLVYGLPSVFVYFGVLAIIGGVLVWVFGSETKGKTLEELSP
jgi:MFS transporter, putative metabolite:H+ symporter